MRAVARPASGRASRTVLFPTCDPRGVLSRALAPDAPAGQTRPDALVFGWMLGLAPGVSAAGAARALLAVNGACGANEHRRALLQALEEIARGQTGLAPRRR